ncbi:MAG: hypothetical protein ACPGVV_10925 [Croceimicrobium sp.]
MLKYSAKIFLALTFLATSLNLEAQDAKGTELKGKIEQFLADHADSYKKKHLNLKMREIGGLENEPFAWKEFFRLESNEEYENTLGYETEREYYFLFYHYETELDRKYALKFWMEDFIEGETIRPSRPKRSYDYAKPTIILINPTNIIILTYDCKYFDEYDFEDWQDKMIEYFGDKSETMVIELECNGPLNWTKNAPDPKIRELF